MGPHNTLGTLGRRVSCLRERCSFMDQVRRGNNLLVRCLFWCPNGHSREVYVMKRIMQMLKFTEILSCLGWEQPQRIVRFGVAAKCAGIPQEIAKEVYHLSSKTNTTDLFIQVFLKGQAAEEDILRATISCLLTSDQRSDMLQILQRGEVSALAFSLKCLALDKQRGDNA